MKFFSLFSFSISPVSAVRTAPTALGIRQEVEQINSNVFMQRLWTVFLPCL